MCAACAGSAWSWRLRHTFADRPWLRLCSCEDRSSIRRPFLCPHISGAVRRWCRSGCRTAGGGRCMCRAADAGRRDRTVTPRSQWLRKTFGVIRRHVLKPWMKPRSRKVEALCGNARNDEGAHGRLHGPSACHVPRHVSEVTLGSARPASSLLPRRPRQCTRTNVG